MTLPLSRRDTLKGGAAFGLLAGSVSAAAAPAGLQLNATAGLSALRGADAPATPVWGYEGGVPGPVVRASQGKRFTATVKNLLPEGTTVHWHGIRLPIEMDGVPGISQPLIGPGEQFTYSFTPPDAGTFWYHPHANSLVQLGRGLAGAMIVDEAEPPDIDRDVVWVLGDWRLDAAGAIAPGFGSPMEAAMSGRVGNTVTLNGRVSAQEVVRSGERCRLRLINSSLARIMRLRFEGHRVHVVAVDGQPCEPHEPVRSRVLLGPAMRLDLILDMSGEPGRRYRVVDDFYDGLAYELTHLAYAHSAKKTVRRGLLRLPPNPLPEPDLRNAMTLDLELQGGMPGAGRLRGLGGELPHASAHAQAVWAINGHSMTGDGHAGMEPLVALDLGPTYRLKMRNRTAWWHPMHLHGHSFLLLSRNGRKTPHRQWADTVMLAPGDTVEAAFVADNPGDWMFHCHVTDHQTAGLMTVLRVKA